ncbi:periplasmic chaperone for outer membrane proteins Skp [Desulfuromusa kysingii]|uniref:Periplasmic chaperone for outer membrane proteins Skp n=1 Tax=Desulfuromusa kysingii TaxID=37625 RepID=A0A1H3YGZ3_9BACT|nr:OmpH family outer membrane protein [Desulfuromusa kysingii]SEA10132.1 periplasmic chaperone for outer membrane proteins Skp [Desulfuromusa kysingii]
MKKMTIALVALLLLSTSAFAANKLAYVDLQKALNLSKAGAQAKTEIADLAKQYETEFKIQQGDFLKLKGELEKQAALLSDTAKQEKIKEYQQSAEALQKFQQDAQRKLQQEDGKRTQEILKELSEILQKFGKDGKYSMIVERSEGGLVFVSEDVDDLTEKLIKAYDESKK